MHETQFVFHLTEKLKHQKKKFMLTFNTYGDIIGQNRYLLGSICFPAE